MKSIDVASALLFRFYMKAMRSEGDGIVPNRDWDSVRPMGVSNLIVHRVCAKLATANLMESVNKPGSQYDAISDLGIQMVEKLISDRTFDAYEGDEDSYVDTEDFRNFREHVNEALTLSSEATTNEIDNEEKGGNEDYWEPLEIDRQNPRYAEAVEKLDTALEVIRSDNGYAQQLPVERDNIVGSLEQGIDLIKNRQPTGAQIRSMVLAPLKHVVQKFGDSVIGSAAKSAVTAIVSWLFG